MLNSFERLLLIRGIPIFAELRDDFLVRLASIMEEQSFAFRDRILTEGEEGRSMFVIAKGTVQVHIGDQKLTELKKGEFFGEMALFDSERRSASITAIEPCHCLVLTQQQLYEAIDETPGIALNIIRIFSRRIRTLNETIRKRDQELLLLRGQSEMHGGNTRLR